MLLEETVNNLIRDTVDLVLQTPDYTIKAKQYGAPRPTGAYATVDFSNSVTMGWEQQELENNTSNPDLTETITGMRELLFSLNFFRSNAIDNAEKFRIGLVRESIRQMYSSAGLGLVRRSPVREISSALEDGWEERAQMDITLSAVGTDSDIVRSIQTIDIVGEFQARGMVYNFNLEGDV